jgi:hypothetical protein
VVTTAGEEARAAGIAPGDTLLTVDGIGIEARREKLTPLVAASTPQALRYRTDPLLLMGAKDSVAVLRVRDTGRREREIKLRRSHDRPALSLLVVSTTQQPLFTVLPEGFGYVDLTRLPMDQVDAALEIVRATPALPSGDVRATFAFEQAFDPVPGFRYEGRIVVLVDERAIS